MPEETPTFSAAPIGDAAPIKKRAPRRPRTAKTTAKKKEQQIERTLESIYREDSGHMPNMKKISRRRAHPFLRTLFAIVIFGGLLAGAAWVGFFILPQQQAFSQDKIKLTITGPQTAQLGEIVSYTVTYENNQTSALKDVALNVRYPDGFVFGDSSLAPANSGNNEWNIGILPSRKKSELVISGIMYGEPKKEQSWRVFMNYRPENLQSSLQKAIAYNVAISDAPVEITLSGPDSTLIGNEVEYVFKLTNTAADKFDKLEIQPAWPENFSVSSSSPALAQGKWTITKPAWFGGATSTTGTPATALTFKARGKYGTADQNDTAVKATVYLPLKDKNYKIAETELKTALVKNNVTLSAAVNGSLKDLSTQPGDMLNITLNLKNDSPTDISKASVKLTLDAPAIKRQSVLDWAAIVDEADGDIQGTQISDTVRRGAVSWNSRQIPALAKIKPAGEVAIDMRLPVKDGEKIDLTALKETLIALNCEVTYTDSDGKTHTISGNPLNLTLNSDLSFEARDVSAEIDGASQHKITWIITNTFHPLSDLKLSAELFGDITFASSTAPAGTAAYNAASKQLVWEIKEMPESVDVLAYPFTVTLNKKNPTQNTLVSKVHITATDTVTGQKLDFMGDEVLLTSE